ncbi:MFS transporter [Paenibacillus hemerocallicola]|uniref:MFS transporter n=1 Tax=Paenibacillus hemerocallicola TaxID=1172614 RepID=A0A5C4T5V7_9BACL|nr:MFS transporter [Paenibacillus hemerocallicola]TNJ63707.1 MFS transporter [Paenibacillus hemerocallicola]
MKTAIWLYLFMFVAFFDLHAQYPILTPFAISLGAAPTFIGWMMGMYSLTHLPGNLLAGYWVDRYGSKLFITLSLMLAGVLLLYQSKVDDPWHLLLIRSISGFVLAFLSPACLAMLAKLGSTRTQQGKLMAGNGLVHTLASVISPAAGALLVAKVGFTTAFAVLGWALIAIGAGSYFFVRETKAPNAAQTDSGLQHSHSHHGITLPSSGRGMQAGGGIPWLFYGVPLGLACSQGILFFELPLMKASQQSLLTSGLLFSMVSLGALCTLSMLFLHKYSPFIRTMFGAFALALAFFGLAVDWPAPLSFSLFLIGMAKGVVFPAMATLLASVSSANRYGRVFSFLAISSSMGAFIGPVVAGQLRHAVSPYFIAFLIMMLALTLLAPGKFRKPDAPPVAE